MGWSLPLFDEQFLGKIHLPIDLGIDALITSDEVSSGFLEKNHRE